MATGDALAVRVDIGSEGDVDGARLEELAASLRRELTELDVDAVDRVEDDAAPDGAKAAEAFVLGALVVKVAKSAGSVAAVVRTLQDWARRGGRTVKLDIAGDTIEITGASAEQQDRLITAWIDRHAVA